METFNDVIIRAQASRLTRNPTKKQAVASKKTKIRKGGRISGAAG